MCKFNLKELIVLVCCTQLVGISVASPLGTLLFDDDYADEQYNGDYDLHYDERQNGTENYRLNINGVVIALPSSSNNAVSSVGLLASNYLLELAEAAAAESGDNESDDDATNEKPYDFEIPTGGNSDEIENAEPVVAISADSIAKPETDSIARPEAEGIANPEAESIAKPEAESIAKPEAEDIAKPDTILITKPAESKSATENIKPEYHIDAISEKGSATSKKDLTEIAHENNIRNYQSQKHKDDSKRQSPSKKGLKRRNRLKSGIRTLIEYLKKRQE